MSTIAQSARAAIVRKEVAFDGLVSVAALAELEDRKAIAFAPYSWGFKDGSVLRLNPERRPGLHEREDRKVWARLAWRAYSCD